MQSDLQFYRELGVRGISSYAEPGDWATYELNHYVLGGLAWNPDANVEGMIREFSEARFGAQAALGRKTYQALEDNVRHFCSLPGTALKPAEDYQRAAKTFQSLAQELDAACAGAAGQPAAAALRRLGLALDYARRDLLLQEARVEKADAPQRKAALADLARFLQAHAQDGVFVIERVSAAKQAGRYGVPVGK